MRPVLRRLGRREITLADLGAISAIALLAIRLVTGQ